MDAPEHDWPQFPVDLFAVAERSHAYAARCTLWLAQPGNTVNDADSDPLIVGELVAIVAANARHAIGPWVSPDGAIVELTIDPGAAAASALAAIDRSRVAWLAMVRTRRISALSAAPFVIDLVWLKHEIARAFPDAAGG
jgi:hypothetical protein